MCRVLKNASCSLLKSNVSHAYPIRNQMVRLKPKHPSNANSHVKSKSKTPSTIQTLKQCMHACPSHGIMPKQLNQDHQTHHPNLIFRKLKPCEEAAAPVPVPSRYPTQKQALLVLS